MAERLRRASMERYKNMRSVSRLIEDFISQNLINIDIDSIKSDRARYDKAYEDTLAAMDPKAKMCEIEFYKEYTCETCQAQFTSRPSDAKYCPACQSPKIKHGWD